MALRSQLVVKKNLIEADMIHYGSEHAMTRQIRRPRCCLCGRQGRENRSGRCTSDDRLVIDLQIDVPNKCFTQERVKNE